MHPRRSFWSVVRGAHLPRILVVYASASLAILQTVDVLQDRLGLPDWVFPGTLVLLVVGVPTVIATALVEAARRAHRGPPAALPPAEASAETTGAEAARARVPPPARLRRLVTWRNLGLVGAAAFGVLAFATAGYMGLRVAGIGPAGTLLGKGVLQTRDRIVLADVENRTSDRELGAVVTEALRSQLEQSTSVTAVPAAEVRGTLVLMKLDTVAALTESLAREVALRVGAKAVLTGEIGAAGSGYLLSAHVLRADSAAALVTVLETAEEAQQLIPALDRLSRRLRERIGESLASIRASPPLADVTTPSLQALRLYSEGARRLDQDPTGDEPIALLRAAVAVDTGFASAYRALGVSLLNRGEQRAEGMAMVRMALERSGRLPLAERYRVRAIYDAYRGDYDRANEAYGALLALNPRDAIALNNLGVNYVDMADFARADSFFLRALQLRPDSRLYLDNHAGTLVALGRYDSAGAVVAALARTGRSLLDTESGMILLSVTQPPDSLLAVMARLRATTPERALPTVLAGVELAALRAGGRLRAANGRATYWTALALARRTPGLALELELAAARARALLLDDVVGAQAIVDTALRRYPLAAMQPDDRPLLQLAYTLALVGRPGEGRQTLDEYRAAQRDGAIAREAAAEELAEGAILLAERRPADALPHLKGARELAIPNPARYRNCRACGDALLARGYDAVGQTDSAIAVYARFLDRPRPDFLNAMAEFLAPTHERLAELYAQRGDRAAAARHGAAFLELWARADPALQPRVAAMRRRLAGLALDRPRE